MLIDTSWVLIGTQSHHYRIELFCVFGEVFGSIFSPFWLHFSLQKVVMQWNFSKIHIGCQTGAFGHTSFIFQKKKKNQHHHLLKKKKRKLTKSKIFKIMHSFSKLGTFGHALSPFQKKKTKSIISFPEEIYFSKKVTMHKFPNYGYSAMPYLGEYNHIRVGQISSNCALQSFIKWIPKLVSSKS